MPDLSFTEELSLLRQGNFLGGLARLGQAVKEGKQHESLVETYNKFKAEKEGLLTTQEQVEETNKRTSLLELPTGDEISPDIKKFVDIASHLDRIEAFQGLYQPYIDAFMTLGDEGINLASSLSKQLADKISLEEKKGELPFQELKWLNMELQYNWNLSQYEEHLFNVEQRKEIQGIAEYMMSTNIFGNLPAGQNKYHSIAERNRITQLENNVLRDAKSKFPNMKEGSVASALKIAKDLTGRKYSYFELTPQQRGTTPVIAYGGYLTSMQAWAEKWLNMNEGYRDALKAYMSQGTSPGKEIDLETGQAVFKYDFDKIKKDAKIYNATGEYMNAWTIMTSNDSPFADLGIMEEITIDGNKVSVPKNQLYRGLLYPAVGQEFFSSFISGNFDYNPAWATFTIAEQVKRLSELGDDTLPIGDELPYMTEEEYKQLLRSGILPEGTFLFGDKKKITSFEQLGGQ